jgi:hypothetical protein
LCGVIINVVCFFRSLKKSDTDNQKKLEAKTEELEKIKSEYKTIKDSINEKDRQMQGKLVNISQVKCNIYRITAILKVKTDIITSIAVSLIG